MPSIALPPHGAIKLTATPDPTSGVVTYQVTGPRVTGCLTLIPVFPTFTMTPSWVKIEMGAGAPHLAPAERPDKLTIHGIELVGGPILEPTEFLTRYNRHLPDIRLRRSTPVDGSSEAPKQANSFGARIVRAVVAQWHTRSDLADLLNAYSRYSSELRFTDLILWAYVGCRTLADADAQLAKHAEFRNHLVRLMDEHLAAQHPDTAGNSGDRETGEQLATWIETQVRNVNADRIAKDAAAQRDHTRSTT